MRQHLLSIASFGLIAAFAAAPAYAGITATPEPEVAGGLIALGVLGVGYRLLRRRFSR
jgi:hypothetical protein